MEIEGGDQHDMAYCRTPMFEQLRLVDVAGDQHESIAVMAYCSDACVGAASP